MVGRPFLLEARVVCTENSPRGRDLTVDLPMEMGLYDHRFFASEEPRFSSLGMSDRYAEQEWWCSLIFTAGCWGAPHSCHRLV